MRVIWRIFELEKEIGWLDPDNFHRGFTGIAEKQLWVASRFVREEQISQDFHGFSSITELLIRVLLG